MQQEGFSNVRGIVIGRFQKKNAMTRDLLEKMVSEKRELAGLPIVANADFGHTMPFSTFPIGGSARIRASDDGLAEITILRH